MREIFLTQGAVAVVDDSDFETVNVFFWHVEKRRKQVYAARKIQSSNGLWTSQYLHQFLFPGEKSVDHRDGNGLNNLRSNLRPASSSQQQGNRRKNSHGTSKFKGVYWDKARSKWSARLATLGRLIFSGRFDDEREAAMAYDKAAIKKWGAFARLNFPKK